MQHCASVRKKDFDEGCSVVSSSRGNKSSSISSSEPKIVLNLIFFNKFIIWFHQSEIFFIKNLRWFLFQLAKKEKKNDLTNKNVFSFFKYSQLKKIHQQNKLVKTSDEFLIWIYDFLYSQVPNKRVGQNKRVGWLFWANFINDYAQINSHFFHPARLANFPPYSFIWNKRVYSFIWHLRVEVWSITKLWWITLALN